MILIAAGRRIEIDDPKNFKAFSVRIEGALGAAAMTELLSRIAVRVKDLSRRCNRT